MKKATLLSVSIVSLALLGCTTTQTEETENIRGIAAFKDDARLGEQVSRICFASRIDGFRTVSKDTVIVESGLRDEFMIETLGSCQNLRHAQGLGLDAGLSCLSDFDKIIVFDSAFGTQTTPFSQERCAIKSIHRWNEDVDPASGLRPEDVEPVMEPLQ